MLSKLFSVKYEKKADECIWNWNFLVSLKSVAEISNKIVPYKIPNEFMSFENLEKDEIVVILFKNLFCRKIIHISRDISHMSTSEL